MSTAAQGHEVRAYYLHEDNGFNSAPSDTDYKPFGANAIPETVEGSNQAVQVFEPGSRVPVEIAERAFDGSWSVTFEYTNPWWLTGLFGAPSTTDNGDGSHTHTFSGESPQSFQIHIGREGSSKTRQLNGCVIATATIDTSVGEAAQITLEGAYAEEETVSSIEAQPTLNDDAMTFADASLSLGGSTLAFVQNGALDIQSDTELLNELGSRTAVDFAPRTLTPEITLTKYNEAGATTNAEKMYGGSTTIQSDISNTEAMTYTLDNGQAAGSGINTVDFNLTGTYPESYAENGLGDPESDVEEEIMRYVQGISVAATNEVATAR